MARAVTLTGGSPWGFTLSGGKDFGSHLQISKLSPGGKAMNSGVKEKEFILEINGQDTQGVTHHGAQQLIRSTKQTLTLLLSSEAPQRSAYAAPQTSQATPPPPANQPQSGGRPRPPPPPTNVTTPPTGASSTVTAASSTTPVKSYKPVQQPVTQPPVIKSSQQQQVIRTPIVNDDNESDPIFQSPTFKKITTESPSALSPKSTQDTPPTQQFKQMTIEDGNTRKSTQRPPPPSNTPTKFTTTSMKVSSNTGPKGQSPVAKPSPPATAAIKRPPPPSVQSSSPGTQSSLGPASPQGKVSSRQGVCEACHEPIRGAYSSAMNKVWHPEHFVCFRCRNPLSGGTFVFEDDKIFCDGCYEKQVAQICSLCRKPILGPMVNATNRYYHHECFRCSRCSTNLAQQEGFNMENNMLFCSSCFTDTYGVSCFGCGQKIDANELWVEALDHTWHPQCFVCGGCRRPLEGSKFFAKLGKPYCGQC